MSHFRASLSFYWCKKNFLARKYFSYNAASEGEKSMERRWSRGEIRREWWMMNLMGWALTAPQIGAQMYPLRWGGQPQLSTIVKFFSRIPLSWMDRSTLPQRIPIGGKLQTFTAVYYLQNYGKFYGISLIWWYKFISVKYIIYNYLELFYN